MGETPHDATLPRPAPSPAPPVETGVRASVWALAGGKGGVGRSLLAANLGIQLARMGRRVVLVDLDLQGSNLMTYLGFHRLPRTLADFASGRTPLLSEIACETPTAHLRLVGGLQRAEMRDDPVAFVRQVCEQFGSLNADHVLVDCGSGRWPAAVAAFAEATVGVLVTTPEPAALEATYLFAEAYLRWCLLRALTGERMADIEGRMRAAGGDPARLSFRAFMTHLGRLDPEARDRIAAVVRRTRLQLVLNQVRGEADEEAAAALQSGFRKCFGLHLTVAGIIEHDLSILQAVQKRRSLSQQYPNAASTKGIGRAATRLLSAAGAPLREADEEWEDLDAIDHYRVLEVVPKASPKEVQSAYQLLKKTYDPETTVLAPLMEAPGLRELQARIEAAYRTLIFLESRSDYDRRLQDHGSAGAATERPAVTLAAPAPPAADRPPEDRAAGPEAAPPAPSLELAGGGPTAGLPAPPAPEAAAPIGGAGGVPASGSDLRDERQRRRLSIEAIAEKTKIRRAYLQAIEEERFGDLPAAVFVRGFLREYARSLGLPGDDVVRQYMKRYQDWQESRLHHPGPPPVS
jgi:flagellar biosynthesis protein FlhG